MSASSKPTTEFAQAGLSRSNDGHPPREGTNLEVLVPIFRKVKSTPDPDIFCQVSRYTSHFYRNALANYALLLAESRIYTTNLSIQMRLPKVSRYFCRSIRVRGRNDVGTPPIYGLSHPSVRLQIWVCLTCLISPCSNGLCEFGWVWSSLIMVPLSCWCCPETPNSPSLSFLTANMACSGP